jgi:hypothetical protein
MRLREIYEDASTGASSSGNIASIANPPLSTKKRKSGRYGAPAATQHTAKDGTLVNALDVDTNIFGGPALKR